MEEEEDKDDKKDILDRQPQAAEASKQGGTSTSKVQVETKKDTDNKGAQGQAPQVFQGSSEILVPTPTGENGRKDVQESITQNTVCEPSAGESSVNSDTHHQGALNHPDKALQNESTEATESVSKKGAILEGKHECANISSKESLETEKVNHNEDNNQQQSAESSNQNVDSGQPKQRQHLEKIVENLGSEVQGSLVGETTEHHGLLEEEGTKQGLKTEQEQLKQAELGDIGKKQIHAHESKQDSSQPVNQRQSQIKKGQKSVQAPKQTGKESQLKEEKEKIHNVQTNTQDLCGTLEVNKPHQKKAPSEQTKVCLDQKLKSDDKQKVQAKEGKKKPLLLKEQRDTSKPTETRKIDKKEQKSPVMRKELQSSPSKKSPVHRKEQISISPKKHASSPVLQKKVKQKVANSAITKKNEPKVIVPGTIATEGSLETQNKQNGSLPLSKMANSSVQPQESAGRSIMNESAGLLSKSGKECGKEVLKECIQEMKVIQKPEEARAQRTSKFTEKKSQQEKLNEMKKQKQQNEAKQQQKKQLKEEKSVEQGKRISPKLVQGTNAPMPHKKAPMSSTLVINKQASKGDKEPREVSTQQSRETDVMQQQLQELNENSSNEANKENSENMEKEKKGEKQNRSLQKTTVNKKSAKERSSENVIHSIRKQYQQLCKEEALQQQQQQSPNQSPHSHQATLKEETLQQEKKQDLKGNESVADPNEGLNQIAQKKSEEPEDEKGLGCGGMQGSSCPIYFGVKSYLHHFYDTTTVKNPQLYEEYTEEDDFEYTVDPIKRRGCRKCCQGFWFRAGLWGGINLILVGVITFLVGYLTPQREMVVGQQGDLEILDRSAIIFNHRLELCRLAGLAVFCCGGMVLFIVLFISTLLHVKGHNNNESTCCAESIYYDYSTAPLVEPFIVTQTQDLTMPTATAIKIPIVEQIKSVQPTIWPEMGTVRDGSRVGQMP